MTNLELDYEDALQAIQGISDSFTANKLEKREKLILLRDEIEDMIANLS